MTRKEELKELNTRLIKALEINNFKEVKAAVENGADINAKMKTYGNILFYYISRKRIDYEILDYLIAKGGNINSDNDCKTILGEAADPWRDRDLQEGSLKLVRYLLDKGADINKKAKYGDTPLGVAVYNKLFLTDKRTADFLLERGADINALDCNGNTLLFMAVYQTDFYDSAVYLIERGIDINRKNNFGVTVLMEACEEGNERMVNLLLNHAVKLDEKNKHGKTALMAASRCYENIAIMLIQKGASINLKDNYGNTALSISYENKNFKLVKALLKAGAIGSYSEIPLRQINEILETSPKVYKQFV